MNMISIYIVIVNN